MSSDQYARVLAKYGTDISALVDGFGDYTPISVTSARVARWISQFNPRHRGLAVRLATSLRYFGVEAINQSMKKLHKLISRQIQAEKLDLGSARFVPLGRTAESGEHITRLYRNINKLHTRQKQFIKASDLRHATHKADRLVVFFLDDFIGTGDQIVSYWSEVLSQLVEEFLPMYIAVVAACPAGVANVESHTPLKVINVVPVGERWSLTSERNTRFTPAEKKSLVNYCKKTRNMPLGYGDLALVLSLSYGTPNNTISLIRGSRNQRPWLGLLPRPEDV